MLSAQLVRLGEYSLNGETRSRASQRQRPDVLPHGTARRTPRLQGCGSMTVPRTGHSDVDRPAKAGNRWPCEPWNDSRTAPTEVLIDINLTRQTHPRNAPKRSRARVDASGSNMIMCMPDYKYSRNANANWHRRSICAPLPELRGFCVTLPRCNSGNTVHDGARPTSVAEVQA